MSFRSLVLVVRVPSIFFGAKIHTGLCVGLVSVLRLLVLSSCFSIDMRCLSSTYQLNQDLGVLPLTLSQGERSSHKALSLPVLSSYLYLVTLLAVSLVQTADDTAEVVTSRTK